MAATVKILILIISIHFGSSALNCPSFFTQGLNENQTVIRLIGNGNESVGLEIDNRLTVYEWNIWTRIISTTEDVCITATRGHVPCYLHAWKSAIELKDQLRQVENVVQYDENGRSLVISNEWINPNMIYTIEVKIIKNGKTTEKFCMTITNNNENDKFLSENPELQNSNNLELFLIGPEQTFCNVKSIINAFVVGNFTNATFQWTLKEKLAAAPQLLEYQGSRLELSENSLNNARVYEVTCALIGNDNDILTVLTKNTFKLTVRKPKYVVRLQSRNQTIGVHQPVKIIAHVDIPKRFKHEIIWTCTKSDSTSCGQFSNTIILNIQSGFSEVGTYEFVLTISTYDFKAKLTTFVEIVDNSIRSIDLDELPTWITPSEELVIPTELKNVRSGCTMKWTSIHNLTENEDNMPYRALNFSESNFNTSIPVYVKRDAFLKELAPFSKEPGHQKITLIISPEALQTTKDRRYLLRLSTGCEGRSAINADLELTTNAPPILTDLQVSPLNGTALFTVFRFETTPGFDKKADMPLTYNFGWSTSEDLSKTAMITYFSKIQGFHMAETVFPYIQGTNGTIFPILKVCDNKDSCTTLQGPIITVMLPTELSEANQDNFKQQIMSDLASNDFDKLTLDVLMIFQTYQSLETTNLFHDLQNATNFFLNEKIKSFLDKPHKTSIYEMITSLSKIQNVFQASRDVHKSLVKLRGKLVNEQMTAPIVTDVEENALEVLKAINSKDLNEVTIQDIRKYFETTEFIITTTDDPDLVKQEKDNFINNIDKYLGEVCVLLYRDAEMKTVKFNLQTAYIILERFTSAYFRHFKYVPNANNEWDSNIQIMLNQTWFMDVRGILMCVAKGMFRDYLQYEGVMYFTKLYSNDMSDLKLNNQSNTITKASMATNNHECSVNSGGSWQKCRKSQVQSNNIACMCDKMGFYKIDESTVDSGENGEGKGEEGNTTQNGGENQNGNNNNGSESGQTTKQPGGTEIGNGSTTALNGVTERNGDGNQDGGVTIDDGTKSVTANPPTEMVTKENTNSDSTDTNNNSNNDGITNNESGNTNSNNNGPSTTNTVDGNNLNSGNTNNENTPSTGENSGTTPMTPKPDVDVTENSGTTAITGSSDDNDTQSGDDGNQNGESSETTVTESIDTAGNTKQDGGTDIDQQGNTTPVAPDQNGENSGNENGSSADGTTDSGITVGENGVDSASNNSSSTSTGDNGNDNQDGGVTTTPTVGNSDGIDSTNSDNTNNNQPDGTIRTPTKNADTNEVTPKITGDNTELTNSGIKVTTAMETTESIPSNPINPTDTAVPEATSEQNNLTTNLGNNNNEETTNNPGDTEIIVDTDEVAVEGGSDGDDVTDIETTENITGSSSNIVTKPNSEPGTSPNGGAENPTTPLNSSESGNTGDNNSGNGGGADANNITTDSDSNSVNTNNTPEDKTNNGDNTKPTESSEGSDTNTEGTNGDNNEGKESGSSNNSTNSGGNSNTNTEAGGTTTSPGNGNGNSGNTETTTENGNNTGSNTNSDGDTNNSGNNGNTSGSGTNSETNNSNNTDRNNNSNSGTGTSTGTITTNTPNNISNNSTNSETSGTSNNNGNGSSGGTINAQNPTAQTPPQTTTDNIRSAGISSGSFMSLGDQISFVVIGLCVLGTGGLVLFGIVSKRVRKVRAAGDVPSDFPMYADIFQKENMH